MSASRGRRRRERTAAAAKAKRQRNFAIAGGILFAIVLVIQVPRILKQVQGPSTSAVTSTTSTTTTAAAAPVPSTAGSGATTTSKALRELITARPVDPFNSHESGSGDPAPGTLSAGRDPFVGGAARTSAPALPAQIVLGRPRAGQKATTGYIVVLASVPTSAGRGSAARIAARARNRGIEGVAVLKSSTKKSLRAGYYVVYVGSYKTQGAAITTAAGLHARGFSDAYIRQILRY